MSKIITFIIVIAAALFLFKRFRFSSEKQPGCGSCGCVTKNKIEAGKSDQQL